MSGARTPRELICGALQGWTVRCACVSVEVGLTVAESARPASAQGVLSLTGSLWIEDEQGRVDLDVSKSKDALGPLLRIIGTRIMECTITPDAALRIKCVGGLSMGVPSDTQYEAWRLRTPLGYLVAQPGGDVSVWLSDDL
jgi:hypothetical protein